MSTSVEAELKAGLWYFGILLLFAVVFFASRIYDSTSRLRNSLSARDPVKAL